MAAEWKLDQPDWTGRLRVCALGKDITIKLDDRNTGELFAQCPVESYPSIAIEQVLDSSRYFVVRIQDGSGRSAFIGIGFADRGDSFDLLVALQDHFKRAKRETEDTESAQSLDEGPKLDLGFKEGQTIRINIATKVGDSAPAKPRPKTGAAGGGLLPPPPGGVKISASPKPAAPPSPEHHSVKSNVPTPSTHSNVDLLLDLGAPPPPPPAASNPLSSTSQPADPWGDFTSAGRSGNPVAPAPPAAAAASNSNPWVNFE